MLVDIDPQANATSGIGIDKNKVDRSAYNALVDETPIAEILMSNLENKISVLPSNSALAGAEVELVSLFSREYRLKKL